VAEPTPINSFEQARCDAVGLLRRVADELEAAEPWRAIEALEHLAATLHALDHTAQLVLPRSPAA